jgi:hypothetical protein
VAIPRPKIAQFAEHNPFETLKKIFLAQAKAQQLAPIENVVLQYLLFSKNADLARFTLANLLFTTPPAAREQGLDVSKETRLTQETGSGVSTSAKKPSLCKSEALT